MLFSINGTMVGETENPNQKISLHIREEGEVFLCCYPLTNACRKGRRISYAAKILLGSTVSCSSQYITLTRYPNNHIEALCKDFIIEHYQTPAALTQLVLSSGATATLVDDGSQSIFIEKNELSFAHKLPAILVEYALTEEKLGNQSCAVLRGKDDNDKQFLLCLDKDGANYKPLIELSAHKIEENENEVTSLELLEDIARHGYVEKYLYQDGEFKLVENYTVFNEGSPRITTNPNLIPYAFMEALNAENIKLARQYLSQSLNTALNDAHLLTFFEDFSEVCWNNYANRPHSLAVIYGTSLREAKIFDFEIENGKITNITCP